MRQYHSVPLGQGCPHFFHLSYYYFYALTVEKQQICRYARIAAPSAAMRACRSAVFQLFKHKNSSSSGEKKCGHPCCILHTIKRVLFKLWTVSLQYDNQEKQQHRSYSIAGLWTSQRLISIGMDRISSVISGEMNLQHKRFYSICVGDYAARVWL